MKKFISINLQIQFFASLFRGMMTSLLRLFAKDDLIPCGSWIPSHLLARLWYGRFFACLRFTVWPSCLLVVAPAVVLLRLA
jgi:hypothetical protein